MPFAGDDRSSECAARRATGGPVGCLPAVSGGCRAVRKDVDTGLRAGWQVQQPQGLAGPEVGAPMDSPPGAVTADGPNRAMQLPLCRNYVTELF